MLGLFYRIIIDMYDFLSRINSDNRASIIFITYYIKNNLNL